jgi:hypothetical protein
MIRYVYRKYKARTPENASEPPTPQKHCDHGRQHDKTTEVKSEAANIPSEALHEGHDNNKDAKAISKGGPCSECKAEKTKRRRYRAKLMIALFPSAFLAAVDTTIVATALTTIASHFGTSIPD